MSLINDALKRARLSRKKKDDPDSQEPPLEPVEPAQPAPSPKGSPRLLLSLVAFLLVAGVWLVWKWWNSPAQPPPQLAAQSTPANESSGTVTNTNPVETPAQTSIAAQIEVATNEVGALPTDNSDIPNESQSTATAAIPPSEQKATVAETNVLATTQTTAPAPLGEPINLQPARPVTFPPLKLQGIFFRLTNPSALINDHTLFLGSTVDGVTVVDIQRSKVIVELNGAREELFLLK